MDLIDLEIGKIVNKKWVIEAKLGEGACGVVYKVHDVENPKVKAALKAEATNEEMGVLKKEANVIKQLQLRKHVVRLIYCGRREQFSYVIMTLYGRNLNQLKKDNNLKVLSAGCVCKIGVQVLYAIKQVHEIGSVHRDVKPSNIVIGRHGVEKRMFFLIDYGMCRSYAVWDNGVPKVRRARDRALLRGTTRYCSPSVHKREEQGRKDDMWSLAYVMVELADRLPWCGKKVSERRDCNFRLQEQETSKIKEDTTDTQLLENCPTEWLDMFGHIRSLKYEDRPNYRLLYDIMINTMKRHKTTFLDPYDWELLEADRTDMSVSALSNRPEIQKEAKGGSREMTTEDRGKSEVRKDKKTADERKGKEEKKTRTSSEEKTKGSKEKISETKSSQEKVSKSKESADTNNNVKETDGRDKDQTDKEKKSEYPFITVDPAEFDRNDIHI